MAVTDVGGAETRDAASILALFRQRGGKATPTRRAVVEVFVADGPAGGHLTAEDILTRCRGACPEIAESTVYGTLAALEDLAVIEPVHVPYGPVSYHLAGSPHEHVQCERCHRIVDVDADEFAGLARQLQTVYGFHVHPHRSALEGLCESCAELPDPTPHSP